MFVALIKFINKCSVKGVMSSSFCRALSTLPCIVKTKSLKIQSLSKFFNMLIKFISKIFPKWLF